jgi:kinesin family protein 5
MRPALKLEDRRDQGDCEENKANDKGNIRVVCRFRPLNEKEIKMGASMCIAFDPDDKTVVMNAMQESLGPMRFTFDYVFQPNTAQVLVYEAAAKPIVESVLQGFNGTVFAYGQTSSGKTHTMTGPSIDDDDLKGIIPRMVQTVFSTIGDSPDHMEFTVKVSYAEIYMEKLRDLLNPEKANLKIHEDKDRGVYIADLTEAYVSEEQEVYQLMMLGGSNREVGFTNMNEGSSRSHSIFALTVTMNNSLDCSARTGKLYLVDLAGSEKVLKTGAEGKRLEEAKGINKSLTMLGLVIYSLTDGKSSHIPYRDSKLTRVLQDSLGGNARTSLIITCSPHPFNEAETLSTLRFGLRAKAIKNKPKVNREFTVAELKFMLARVEQELLQKDRRITALEEAVTGLGGSLPTDTEAMEERKEESKGPVYDQILSQLEEERQKLAEETTRFSHMRKELMSQTARNSNLMKENDSLSTELATLTIKYAAQQERLQEQEEKLMRLTAHITLETKLQEAHDQVGILRREYSNSKLVTKLLAERELLDLELAKLTAGQQEQHALLAEKETKGLQDSTSGLMQPEGRLLDNQETSGALTGEIEALTAQSHADVETSVPALGVFKLAEAIEEREPWGEEKGAVLIALQSMTDKASRLQLELEDAYEGLKAMEARMAEDQDISKKKISSLEHALAQLTGMHRQLLSHCDMMKVDFQVYEKKLLRFTGRCDELLKQLSTATEELTLCRSQCRMLTSELNELKRVVSPPPASLSVSGKHRIRKTIKGGNKVIIATDPRRRTMGVLPAFSLTSFSDDEQPSLESLQ